MQVWHWESSSLSRSPCIKTSWDSCHPLDDMQIFRAQNWGVVIECQNVRAYKSTNESRQLSTTTIKPSSTLSQKNHKGRVIKNMKLGKISLAERERIGKQAECVYDFDCAFNWQGWCYSIDQCRYKVVMAKDGTKHWEGWDEPNERLEGLPQAWERDTIIYFRTERQSRKSPSSNGVRSYARKTVEQRM